VNIGPPVNTNPSGSPRSVGFNESNPHLSGDGDTLYFEADHGYPGTDYYDGPPSLFGGSYDLYYAVKQPDGSWSTPVNMGPSINTSDTQKQAWVGIDGFTGKKVIYFVRYLASGESYIYCSEFTNGQWSPARKVLFGDRQQPLGGEPSLTADGRFLYITYSESSSPQRWVLDIWYAERRPDGSWSWPKPVD
jgi:hypothetical protein